MTRKNIVHLVIGHSVINLDATSLYALLQCYDWLRSDGTAELVLGSANHQAIQLHRDVIELALDDLAKLSPHREPLHRLIHKADS
jgi:hypothetical protein